MILQKALLSAQNSTREGGRGGNSSRSGRISCRTKDLLFDYFANTMILGFTPQGAVDVSELLSSMIVCLSMLQSLRVRVTFPVPNLGIVPVLVAGIIPPTGSVSRCRHIIRIGPNRILMSHRFPDHESTVGSKLSHL